MQDINSRQIPLSICPIGVGATTLSKMTPNIITLIKTTISVTGKIVLLCVTIQPTVLRVIMLSVVMPNVIVLSVNMLSAEYYYAV